MGLISITLNGRAVEHQAQSREILADALHDRLGCSSVRVACDQGVCGACTVLADGQPITSCLTRTESMAGSRITTLEGLRDPNSGPSAVQLAFAEARAFQCGFCTAGMILLAEGLLARHPHPTNDQVRQWMSANVCRCTGYRAIVEAVQAAARRRPSEPPAWQPEVAAKLLGAPHYTVDIVLPGMAHAKILRSPHAHAKILAIRTERAKAVAGVLAVCTGADLNGEQAQYGLWIKDQPVLATDRVRYIGDPIAAVAAVDEETAFEALKLIAVDYELLPVLDDIEAALAADAPALFDRPSPGHIPAHGDGVTTHKEPGRNILYDFRYVMEEHRPIVDEHVFEDEFTFSRMSHIHLEPLITLAAPSGDGIEIWSVNQDPFLLRQDISEIFAMPEHLIRIHTGAVGGGFGAKSFCKLEPLAVLLALKARCPVRLCLSMDEGMVTLSQHAARLKLTTRVTSQGDLLSRTAEVMLDGGAYADASALVADKVGYRLGGPYRWKHLDCSVSVVRTNTVPAGSFRGFGGTQASWASESQMDMIARRLGLDPMQMRLRNLIPPGEPFRPGDSGLDCDLAAGLRLVAARIGYGIAPTTAEDPTKRRGIGLAIGFKDAGGQGRFAQARVRVNADGTAVVNCATVEIGQGADEVFRVIAGRVLGLTPDRIARARIDTDQTPFDQGTHASAATAVTGEAVRRAAEAVKIKVEQFAATQLGCMPEDLSFSGGSILHRGNVIPLRRLVSSYYGGLGAEFTGEGEVKIQTHSAAALNAQIVTWMPHWVAVQVEVDLETGLVLPTHIVTAGDAGTALVPAACRGQIEGGTVQGLAQALFEELTFDGATPENAHLLKYRVPLMNDVPLMEAIVLEQGMGRGPFGTKGLGEVGVLGMASAIANAVEDAVGIRIQSLPITPPKVLSALSARRSKHQERR